MAEKKETKLPKAANSTSRTYNQYAGANPLGMYNPTGIPIYGRNPWSGALDAADFNYPSPIVPTWGGGWDARNYARSAIPPISPVSSSAVPSYGMSPTSTMFQESPYPEYKPNGQFMASTAPTDGFAYSPQPVASATTGELMAGEPGGQPLENMATPTAGQPSYELDAYNNPIDPYWYQNNANTMQMGANGPEPRPGVPAAFALKDYAEMQAWEAKTGNTWTSSYSPEFYKTQRPDDFNVWGIAGGMGKRNGTTQLRWGTPTPDWVRKVLDKNKDTNKSYDQSQLDQNQPVNLRNIPGWAGDLVSWRT